MNDSLTIKMVNGYMPTDDDLKSELYDICDREHAGCNENCPVFLLNDCSVPNTVKDFKKNRGCDCFKNGAKMLEFIRKHNKS